jgi:murein DD-endopeptidase MepM/ murein hydrolase activator NlpD
LRLCAFAWEFSRDSGTLVVYKRAMGPVKLRILLCVLFLVIVSLVSVAIRFRTSPVVPAIDIPRSLPNEPVAIGTPLPADTPPPPPSNFVGTVNLIIPVAGVQPEQLIDTFDAARSEGRFHDAIDIPAAAETPVLAASDGKILKLFQSERGGTTIYQMSQNQELIFYYAHLSRYADGLVEGNTVRQGEVIAYVGDTGNAGPGNYHLHFSIALVSDPKRYWEGTNINPYPLLQNRAR